VLTLPPYHTRRAWLRAFWLVLSATAALLLAAALAAAGRGGAGVTGLVCFALLAVPGWLRPYALSVPYRAWNRGVRAFAELASGYVTRVCLWGIFPVVGAFGSAMRMKPGEAAGFGWAPREVAPGEAAGMPEPQRSDWYAAFRAWSARDDRRWTRVLLPFLLLLALLEEDPEQEVLEHDVYTLY